MNRAVSAWVAVLAGPVAWFASLLANFALTAQICARGWKALLFAVTILALILTASAGVLAWRLWRETGVELPGETAGVAGFRRSMGLAGVLLSGMFVVVIIAQAIPNLIFRGCE